ncbi:TPA: hypothetical protein N0F65_010441 [Lagenidium giganteum]|uniref:Uncharacterized protein n=1 Tax=Lagenidium giganteum TaxID=4803 RepID=A0AAV2YUZ7_9STRA|nr:TPA: hypothetical protein N0F65_010441 [Lagenidium giganteum]
MMDIEYSFKSRGDSCDSSDSFDVVSLGDLEEDANGQWEDLGAANNPFNDPPAPRSVSCASGSSDDGELVEVGAEEQETPAPAPSCNEPRSVIENPTAAAPETLVHVSALKESSPIARNKKVVSRNSHAKAKEAKKARESLKAFYLARAKHNADICAERRASMPEDATPPTPIPPPPAPARTSVQVWEKVKRADNMRKANLALEQYYAQRARDKAQRARINRQQEAELRRSQSGLSTTHWYVVGSVQ